MLMILSVASILLAGCGWWGATQEEPTVASAPAVPLGRPSLVRPIDQGVHPDRIEMPSIHLETDVVELGWHPARNDAGAIFSEWDVAYNAAGWHKNSALLGQGGNVVLSGHNNVAGAVFRELDQLKKGDEAIVWSGGRRFRYLIENVMIVPEKYASQEQREENASWIKPLEDDRLTLVSCWPQDDNSHRIIVVARPEEIATAQN